MDDNNLNPVDLHAREDFGDEIPKSIKSSDTDSAERAREAERNPGFSYTEDKKSDDKSSASSSKDEDQPTKGKGRAKTFLKKGGPITTLVLSLITSGGIFVGTLTPAVGINHYVTAIERHFNLSGSVTDSRKIAAALGKNNAKNVLGSKRLAKRLSKDLSAKSWLGRRSDRFANMSKKTIANLEKNGWKIDFDPDPTAFGRYKVKGLSYEDGPKLTKPKDLRKALADDAGMTKSLQRSLRGKFANTVDRVARSALARAKIGIKKLFGRFGRKKKTDASDVGEDIGENIGEVADSVEIDISEEMDNAIGSGQADDGAVPRAKSELDQSKVDADDAGAKAKKTKGQAQLEEIEQTTKNAKAARRASTKHNPALSAASSIMRGIGGALSIGDSACSVFVPMYTAISFLKTDNAASLARFALIFFQGAGAIRAGDATEEEISKLGGMLFTTRSTGGHFGGGSTGGGGSSGDWGGEGEVERSAASSAAYSLAAYQQVPDLTKESEPGVESATRFQNGLPAGAAGLYHSVGGSNGAVAKLCGFLNSPTGQTVSLLAGVAGTVLAIATGGVSGFVQAIVSGLPALARNQIAELAKPQILGWLGRSLISSVTGLPVSSMTRGEDAGNAIGAGAGVLFGKIAGGTSGGVLSKPAAVNAYRAQQVLVAREAEANRATLSPFDISTPDTFMGSIVSSLLPYFGQIQTFRGQVRAVASLAAKSIHQALPSSKAMASSATNVSAIFNQCQDYDYNQGVFQNAAFDIFCNPVYGIPIESLYTQSEAVAMGLPLTQPSMVAGPGSTEPINYVGNLFTPDKVILYLIEAGFIDANGEDSYAEPITTNPAMKNYRDQCITRGMAPLADAQLLEDSNGSLGEHQYGKDVGDGRNCILESISNINLLSHTELTDEGTSVINRDSLSLTIEEPSKTSEQERVDRIMFALFYTDERAQCIIDQEEDCQLDPTIADTGSSSSPFGEIVSDGDWPLEASQSITDTFGCRIHPLKNRLEFHQGIDIGAPAGEAVVAVRDGTVTALGTDSSAGNFIKIRDADGNTYGYFHLEKPPDFTIGQAVTKGQKLGTVGSTGDSTGPHLHFQVQDISDLYQHPLKYLGALGSSLLDADSSKFKDQGVSAAETLTACSQVSYNSHRGPIMMTE